MSHRTVCRSAERIFASRGWLDLLCLITISNWTLVRTMMIRIAHFALLSTLLALTLASAQTAPAKPPLRVSIVGLVHGHVHGFLPQSLHSPEIEIVGIAE